MKLGGQHGACQQHSAPVDTLVEEEPLQGPVRLLVSLDVPLDVSERPLAIPRCNISYGFHACLLQMRQALRRSVIAYAREVWPAVRIDDGNDVRASGCLRLPKM